MSDTTIANIDYATDTFASFITKANSVITVIRTTAVTTDLTANGGFTTGNAYVSQILGSNTLVCTNLRAGNVQSPGTLLTIGSNTSLTGTLTVTSTLALDSNVCSMQSILFVSSASTANQVADSFPLATFRSGKYLISVKDNTANAYQVTEVLITHDGTSTYLTEYATLSTNTVVGSFGANVQSGNINILYSPTASVSSTLRLSRTLLNV